MPAAADMPLTGISVVVTRARQQSVSLVAGLEQRGASVVSAPMIATADPNDGGAALAAALDEIERFSWLVVTSPNGAQRLGIALAGRALAATAVAAVGPATVAALANLRHNGRSRSAVLRSRVACRRFPRTQWRRRRCGPDRPSPRGPQHCSGRLTRRGLGGGRSGRLPHRPGRALQRRSTGGRWR